MPTYTVRAYPILSFGRFGAPVVIAEERTLVAARAAARRALLSENGMPRNVVEVRNANGRILFRYWHATEEELTWEKGRLVRKTVCRPRVFRGSISRNLEAASAEEG